MRSTLLLYKTRKLYRISLTVIILHKIVWVGTKLYFIRGIIGMYTILFAVRTKGHNERSVTNYKHDSQQSGTKGSLPPSRILCRRFSVVKTRAHTCTACSCTVRRHNLQALGLGSYVPPYNSETGNKSDSPGVFASPPRAKIIIAINYRRKSRWFCTTSWYANLVSNPRRGLSRRWLSTYSRPQRTPARRALMVSPLRTHCERVDYITRDFVRP